MNIILLKLPNWVFWVNNNSLQILAEKGGVYFQPPVIYFAFFFLVAPFALPGSGGDSPTIRSPPFISSCMHELLILSLAARWNITSRSCSWRRKSEDLISGGLLWMTSQGGWNLLSPSSSDHTSSLSFNLTTKSFYLIKKANMVQK